jgi:hypothetical protein
MRSTTELDYESAQDIGGKFKEIDPVDDYVKCEYCEFFVLWPSCGCSSEDQAF